jgi:hypothetical protein
MLFENFTPSRLFQIDSVLQDEIDDIIGIAYAPVSEVLLQRVQF